MNRVRLLSEQVSNQIAAGEVVERPASVVKELVENALDAGATRLTVEVQAGGRSLIRVVDDGHGMSRDDALLCLERHATSKIRQAEDLSIIQTLGFRGEAIPSIASVSRLALTTREKEADEGTQVIIHGGRILEVKAAGSAVGTSMEVRQLFYNLPARRKFLRTEETERAHIQHYLSLVALAYPEVAQTFIHDGRVVWQLPALDAATPEARARSVHERMRTVHGQPISLVPVHYGVPPSTPDSESDPTSEPGEESFHLWGFVGAPGTSRATRDEQHVFVNRRPVENRGLNFALAEGYHSALMKGRYPVCCLFLEISPAAVDVNIHPAKREIKFHREASVRRQVAQAVRQALVDYHQPAAPPVPAPPGPPPAAPAELAPPAELPGLNPASPQVPPASPRAESPRTTVPPPGLRPSVGSSTPAVPVPRDRPTAAAPATSVTSGPAAAPAAVPGAVPMTSPLLQVPLRFVGIIGRLYAVLESDRGLVLLDQHAAHERVLFEQMMARGEGRDAPSQRLLLPETVELSARDAQFLKEQMPVLVRLGVGLSEFGDRTFLLDALPPFVRARESQRFVRELVDELKAAGEGVNSWRLGEETITKTVCRHAVKANDPLSGEELENLVRDLRHCAMPYTCPHGRPTLIEMSFRELERKFGRSV